MTRSSCLVFLLLVSSLIPHWAEAAAINSLKNFIQQTRTVRANFSQTLYDKSARTVQESKGTMQFERPEKFRWTYDQPYEQLIVGDGSKVWFYDRDLNQVTERPFNIAIGSSPAALLAGSSAIEIMALRDSFGQTTILSFSDFDKNPTLPADLFQFTPPGNADVIRE
ncbi:MAG: outer membrane lipoprotein carrier protein LolA [Nitrosomonadaceae bacterium]|nr:outer membrane lipoprotein carrier protein LolA [Nitrosomonadaceae bacterium]